MEALSNDTNFRAGIELSYCIVYSFFGS